MSQLPPLPDPASIHWYHPDPMKPDYVKCHEFTEAQMLAYRAATVEACAAVCESLYGKYLTDAAEQIRGMK